MWKVVLYLCAATWSLGEAQETRMRLEQTVNQMTREVVDELKEILELDLRSILPGSNVIFKTKYSFDKQGMGPLYNTTEGFVDLVARFQAYPEGVVTVSDGHLYVAPLSKEWSKWLSHYLGPIAIVCVALLFALILPLAGLFWCCCYWCRVGCRRRPFDGEYDSWIRALLAILFICLLTLFLLGIVCVFTAETHVNDNLGDVTGTYRSMVQDAILFIDTAKDQAIFLLEKSFFEIKERLMDMLAEVVPTSLRVLNDASNLRSLSTLNRLVQQLDDLRDHLAAVHNLTNALRVRAVDLNSGLRKVKNQLLQTLSRCDQPKCVALHNKYKIGQLDTEIQYSQIPDVSGLLANITRLTSSGFKEEMVDSSKVLRSLQRSLQSAVDERAPAVRGTIDGVGDKLKDLADQIRWAVGNVTVKLHKHVDDVQVIQDAVDEYGVYRQYLGMAAALCLLLMVALLSWGLLVGVCGERPEVYGAHDCGSKASGARSLLCGVAVVFTLGGFVALVFTLNFVVGVLTQRFVCDPLMVPLGNRLFRDVDAMVDLERTLYGERKTNFPSLTSVLVQCHRNFTVYEVLRLKRVLDLENLPIVISPADLAAGLSAGGMAGGLAGGLAGGIPPILGRMDFSPDSSLGMKLKQLAESGLADFDFERIRSALDTNLTSLALDGLARQLNSTAASLARPQWAAEARDLQRAAADLDALSRRVLAPMQRDRAALRNIMGYVVDNLPADLGGQAMSMLGPQAAAAQQFLAENAEQLMQMVMEKISNMIAEKLTDYIKHATFFVRYDVGRCGPLSVAFNATRDSLCLKVVEPMHGYWMALGWCILLFVPLMVVARRLAELYMQVDPYPGPLVEAEYLYDAYADRDNVPLANERNVILPAPRALFSYPVAYKAEKRAGREGREGRDGREMRESRELRARRGGEGRAAGAGAAGGAGPARPDSPLAPPLDAYHARRYNDMAPKHWEEGPPRYHGPTEYERPPPYYYPGPNDRQ